MDLSIDLLSRATPSVILTDADSVWVLSFEGSITRIALS
jgi:hypothetical protein